jgi:hypothetical protein
MVGYDEGIRVVEQPFDYQLRPTGNDLFEAQRIVGWQNSSERQLPSDEDVFLLSQKTSSDLAEHDAGGCS